MTGPRFTEAQPDPFPSPGKVEKEYERVGDMPPAMLVSAFYMAVAQLLVEKGRLDDPKDPRVANMTASEFTELSLSHVRMKALEGAVQEESLMKRVLTDWQTLMNVGAVTAPCRLTNKKEADEFYKHVLDHFNDPNFRGQFVVAVGIVSPEGGAVRAPIKIGP